MRFLATTAKETIGRECQLSGLCDLQISSISDRFQQTTIYATDFQMTVIKPYEDESPIDFVERADALQVSDELISDALKRNFSFSDDGEIKKLKLQSKVFWEEFYTEHVSQILKRGGARYSALRFVQKKNAYADQRRKLSDEEIDLLIDSVGEWSR